MGLSVTGDGHGINGRSESGNPLIHRGYSLDIEPLAKKDSIISEPDIELEIKGIAIENGDKSESGTEKGQNVCAEFEQILELVGGEGKFQKRFLYAVLCPIAVICPFIVLNNVFLWDVPEHWCHVPGWDPQAMGLEQWKNLTLPWENGPEGQMRHSQCKMIDQRTGNETKCQFGWEYDKTDYSSTIPSEFNWVCERDTYATDCFTWGSMGATVGNVIFGIMADKIGRKPVYFLSCAAAMSIKSCSMFLPKFCLAYKCLQLLDGFASTALFNMPTLICAEVSGTSNVSLEEIFRKVLMTRTVSWIYAVTWIVWVVGNAMMPGLASICRDWFLFGWVMLAPGFILLLYYPVLVESPRWLITKGRTDQATEVILKVVKANGKIVKPAEIRRMVSQLVKKHAKETKDKSIGVWTLFSKSRIAKNTIMVLMAWTVNGMLYYALTLHTTHMAGNKFLNYFLIAIIEVPGAWVGGKLLELTGRRWTQSMFYFLGALSCLMCAVAVAYPNYTTIVIIGALGINFNNRANWLPSIGRDFPNSTPIHWKWTGPTVGSVIGIGVPYIVYTGTLHVSFPYAVLCFCSLIGVVATACLPETFKQNLPETIEDATNFGKEHNLWSYLPQSNKDKETPELKNDNNDFPNGGK